MMAKQIAVIGSSGGNLYSQGGNSPTAMLKEILSQAASAGMEIAFVQFIAASASMDGISGTAPASLFQMENGTLAQGDTAPLNQINQQALALDSQLAEMIDSGKIDGIIMLSSDPKNTNAQATAAAVQKKVAVAGTGGTSMGTVQSMGARVISASGTTGTTNRTRAVAFIAALAQEFGLKYTPVIGNTGAGAVVDAAGPWKRINFRGIMMAALPGFIAMAIILAVGKIPGLAFLETEVFTTLIGILPAILAAIAAKQISGLDEIGIVAGIVAGILAKDGGIIGGLCAGILAGVLVYYIATFCYRHKMPATTVSIVAGGLSGLVAGLVGMYLIAPAALWLGDGIRWLIDSALVLSPVLAGALAGVLIWPAIIGGVYHAAILPIVLLEMETYGSSFLGAIDMTGLVMVSAGITLANIVLPRTSGDRTAAVPGFLVNMGFGTFVEAAYPYMFSSKLVFAGALIASGVSGAMVGGLGVRGTAYVTSFAAPALANQGHAVQFALCMAVALGLSFLFTLVANRAALAKEGRLKQGR